MDKISKEARSRNMAAIKHKDTEPELVIRRGLHALGLRYRIHKKNLPGKPDLYFAKYKTAVFIHGCFWHQHKDCSNAVMPKTNRDFWMNKLNGNVNRDQSNISKLSNSGIKVVVVWECTIVEHMRAKKIDNLIEGIHQILIEKGNGVYEF